MYPDRALHELVNSVHHLPEGSEAIGPTNPRQWIELTLGIRRLQRLPERLGTDGNSSRAALREAYGADPAAVESVLSFAAEHHLVAGKPDRLSARMRLSGTAADLCDAFNVQLMDYAHPRLGEFHARTGAVWLPDSLLGAVTGVFGFTTHRLLRRTRLVLEPTPSPCVGLLEFGRRLSERDLQAWFERRRERPPELRVVNLDGVWQGALPDSAGDVMRDVEAASASSRVAIYFSGCDAKGLVNAVARVLEDEENAPAVVCVNWACDESQPLDGHIVWSPATVEHVNDSLLALLHLGVTVFVAADEAAAREGQAHVDFPATSPYVRTMAATAGRWPPSVLGARTSGSSPSPSWGVPPRG
jgi:kumamolisin